MFSLDLNLPPKGIIFWLEFYSLPPPPKVPPKEILARYGAQVGILGHGFSLTGGSAPVLDLAQGHIMLRNGLPNFSQNLNGFSCRQMIISGDY